MGNLSINQTKSGRYLFSSSSSLPPAAYYYYYLPKKERILIDHEFIAIIITTTPICLKKNPHRPRICKDGPQISILVRKGFYMGKPIFVDFFFYPNL